MALQHGGQLLTVAQQFNIPVVKWLDLSTGIAPYHYPIPAIPPAVWAHLPQASTALLAAATAYYGCPSVLPVHGSQSVIQRLPSLWQAQLLALAGHAVAPTVYLPQQGYREHEKAWRDAGSAITYYQKLSDIPPLKKYAVVVLINPNNPTGDVTVQTQVLALLQAVKQQQGLLIVDEAFMDAAETNQSVMSYTQDSALIVLRSLGKFFGLAGLRLGFVAACPKWQGLITADQGPWAVSGPAQFVGAKALADTVWQLQQRQRLIPLSTRLAQLLQRTFHACVAGTPLFQTVYVARARVYYQQLCEQAIYVRLLDDEQGLRFGIPLEKDFARLEQALLTLNLTLPN